MVRAALRGLGWVTASGWGRGRSGSPFAWEVGGLPPLAGHPTFAEAGVRSGRMDELSRLGFVGVSLALEDAGLAACRARRPVALLASSAFGCLATDADYWATALPREARLASPNLFAYTLHNCLLCEPAIRFGLTGPNFAVAEAGSSGLGAVTLALESLASGECPAAVAGACDLAPPPWAAGTPGPPPGAVFLVLGDDPETPAGATEPYGTLSLGPSARVLLDGEPVASLGELVEMALIRRRPPAEESERLPCA